MVIKKETRHIADKILRLAIYNMAKICKCLFEGT